jgi:hypothetical protein
MISQHPLKEFLGLSRRTDEQGWSAETAGCITIALRQTFVWRPPVQARCVYFVISPMTAQAKPRFN